MKREHIHGKNGYHSQVIMLGGRGIHLQLICIDDGVIYREIKIINKATNGGA